MNVLKNDVYEFMLCRDCPLGPNTMKEKCRENEICNSIQTYESILADWFYRLAGEPLFQE